MSKQKFNIKKLKKDLQKLKKEQLEYKEKLLKDIEKEDCDYSRDLLAGKVKAIDSVIEEVLNFLLEFDGPDIDLVYYTHVLADNVDSYGSDILYDNDNYPARSDIPTKLRAEALYCEKLAAMILEIAPDVDKSYLDMRYELRQKYGSKR